MLSRLPIKALFGGILAVLLLAGVSFAAINLGTQDKPLPEETAVSVVEKFYEYISEAKIRGGSLLINEAYKLTGGAETRTGRALFLGVVNRYPPGFKADVVEDKIVDRHAVVTIEFLMPSSFGNAYRMRTQVHLNVDENSNRWKLDFRGDTDDQDRKSILKAAKSESFDAASGKSQ
jgi:hypothetical protein